MMKTVTIGLMAAMALAVTPAAYAADNGTEFGVEDDITVLGTEGTAVDPDAEIKGFTVFGATQAAPALQIPVAPGNVFLNGHIQVSSGMYVNGSSTFTSTVYLPAPGSLFVTGGANGQVMTKNAATGALQWSDASALVSGDNLGNHIATTTLKMAGFDLENAGYVTASSAALSGQLVVYGTSTLTGNSGVGGTLDVGGKVTAQAGLDVTGGNAVITNNLNVNGNAQLGNDPAVDIHAVNMAPESDVALSVKGDGTAGGSKYAAKFYSGASLAAWIKKK